MNKTDANVRIEKLRKLIAEYRYEYHVNDSSIMPEAAADGLKKELADLEDKFPDLITANSPTQRVAGQALDKFEKAKHSSRMLSLNDVFNKEDLQAWIDRIAKVDERAATAGLFIDLKMDGLACALIYEKGQLVRAVTRGDGFVGEVVTENVRTIESVPLSLPKDIDIEVRGEIVIHKKDFNELNKARKIAGEEEFKNPRNLAAGTIRQLDPQLVSERPLTFYAYQTISDPIIDISAQYELLQKLGFKSGKMSRQIELNEVEKFLDTWQTKRDELPYQTDGAVIKINDADIYAKLGVVGKAPRGAVAFKYPAEEAVTKIKDIIVSIGRTGAATPVALMEPVSVAGTTVQHASLHNQDEIDRKDIRVGDTVVIFKAGDIIPQVQKVLTELRDGSEAKFSIPQELKKLGYEYERPEGEVVWRVSVGSGEMLKRSIQYYASRPALDIEGLGEKNVIALIDAGLVKDLADIYNLKRDDVLTMERFADLSTDNLLSAIDEKRDPDLDRFLIGLGIRHVGSITARDLAKHFGSLDSIRAANYESLARIDGIGEIVAHSLVGWFANENNQDLLEKLKSFKAWPKEFKLDLNLPLTDKNFAITGTLQSMSRDEAADKIRALGGTFQSSVGKNTTYLVAAGKVGKSKLEKAEKFGVEVIYEDKLKELVNE